MNYFFAGRNFRKCKKWRNNKKLKYSHGFSLPRNHRNPRRPRKPSRAVRSGADFFMGIID